MNQIKLSDRLKQLRKEKNISQTEMAHQIGVSYSQYSRYEARDAQPTAEVLNRIAVSLGTTVDFLLNGKNDQRAQATLKDSELIRQFIELETLPEQEKNSITKVISALIRDYKVRQSYAI